MQPILKATGDSVHLGCAPRDPRQPRGRWRGSSAGCIGHDCHGARQAGSAAGQAARRRTGPPRTPTVSNSRRRSTGRSAGSRGKGRSDCGQGGGSLQPAASRPRRRRPRQPHMGSPPVPTETTHPSAASAWLPQSPKGSGAPARTCGRRWARRVDGHPPSPAAPAGQGRRQAAGARPAPTSPGVRLGSKGPVALPPCLCLPPSPADLEVHRVAANHGKGRAVARPRLLQRVTAEGRVHARAPQRVPHPVAELLSAGRGGAERVAQMRYGYAYHQKRSEPDPSSIPTPSPTPSSHLELLARHCVGLQARAAAGRGAGEGETGGSTPTWLEARAELLLRPRRQPSPPPLNCPRPRAPWPAPAPRAPRPPAQT